MVGPERLESVSLLSSPKGSTLVSASVVIPTYNRVKSLMLTLKAILLQESLPREVVVVDDCSNDGTELEFRRLVGNHLPFRLVYLRQKRNCGPAAARNLGVVNASYDIVLFTDDDCEPEPQWVGELVSFMRSSPHLAGVGGPVVSAERSRVGLFFDHHHLLDPKFVGPEDSPVYLVTANAAYRKHWLLRVGGFNEGFVRPGGEDPDLSFKVSAAGGMLGFAPRAIVRHHYQTKFKPIVRMFWNYGYGGYHVALVNTNHK